MNAASTTPPTRTATSAPARILHGRIDRLRIETLESRIVYSVTLGGVPTWIDQGPGPIFDGNNVGGIPNQPQVGAVEQIAVDSADADHVFLATVGGGIWRSDNATAASPTWIPLTDNLASNSFAGIAIDPSDPSHNTVWAAYGRTSSGGGDGTPALGIIRSTDDGVHWAQVGTGAGGVNLLNQTFRSIIPTGVNDVGTGQQIILAASAGVGLYRSIDNGNTFTNVSDGAPGHLPNAGTSHVAADPTNNQRYYTSVPGVGVFRSVDAGATWTAVNTGLNALATNGADDNNDGVVDDAGEALAATARIEVSVGAGGSVFAALVSNTTQPLEPRATGARLYAVFHSADNGGNWAVVGTAPKVSDGAQGGAHMAILADATDADKVYVTGDRGPDGNSGGANGFKGNLFRGSVAGNTWTELDAGGAGGTSPHPDARDLQFQGGTILHADDGGVYRLVNPNGGGAPQWSSLLGNLHNTEFYSVAYDSRNNAIFGGTQDNGSPAQTSAGGFTWRDRTGGDGGFAGVDDSNAGSSIHYASSQGLGNFLRQTFTGPDTAGGATNLTLTITGAGGANFFTVEESVTPGPGGTRVTKDGFTSLANNPTTQFIQPYIINAVTPTQILIGTNFLYESTDQGDNLTSLGGLQDLTGNGLDDDSDTVIDDADEFRPVNSLGATRAMAYGGFLGGVGNADFTLVGTTGSGGNKLFLRTTDSTGTTADFAPLTAFTGLTAATPIDVVIDPDNDAQFLVLGSNSHVYLTTNTGTNFSDITGNLTGFSNDLRTIEFYNGPGDEGVLVGGLNGVFRFTLGVTNATWSQYGIGLPGVLVKDLHYKGIDADAGTTDDVLIAGTWGRGAFKISNVSTTINSAGVLQINGDTDYAGEDDTIKLIRNSANPQQLDVFINNMTNVPDLEVPLAAVKQINVNTLGGIDTLILDSTSGLISVPNGTRYDGGTQRDSLQLLQTGGSQPSDVYNVGPNNGDGSSVIQGPTGTQAVQFQNIEPVFDNVPAPLIVNATPAANAINYGPGTVIANGLVSIDDFETIEFTAKTTLTINALAGSDAISLHNDNVPTGLTGITVNAGDPTGSDQLLLSGTSAADAFTLLPTSLTAGSVTGVVLPLTYTGAEHLVLEGDGGDDTFNLNGAGGHVSLLGNAGADRVNFSTAAAGVVFDLDAVGVDQRINSGDALVTLLDRMENFTGTASADILRVTASTFARDVFGGLPSLPPGDRLIIDGQGAVVSVMKTDLNTGTVKINGYANITFDEFESFSIVNSPGGPGGFGPPGDNSGAFNTAHAYSLTKFLIAGKPAPGKNPTAVATGDLNGDGFADIVSTDSKTGNISVLLNQGDGTFFDPVNIKTGGSAPQDLVIGQFDGGAGLDVVVTNAGSKNLSLFSGNGAGGFAAPTLIPVAAQPYAIAAGNFNGGAQDIVITHLGKKQVGVLLGTGAGLGTETLFNSVGVKPIDVAVGDFNGDGFTDVVTANNGSASVSLLNGNGAGALAAALKFKVGVNPTGVAVGDFDLDGKPDVAVSHFVSRFVSLLLTQNAGAAIFKPELRVVLPGFRAPTSIVTGDLDGDGLLDLVVADSRGTNITALLGNGPATFTQPYSFNLGKFDSRPKIGGAALADLNNDGLLDIVASIQGNDDVRVLLRHV